MVCPPARRELRTAAPGSCAEGRFQDRRASHLRGATRQPHPAAPVMLRALTSSTRKTYPRRLRSMGEVPRCYPRRPDKAVGLGPRMTVERAARTEPLPSRPLLHAASTEPRTGVSSLQSNSPTHVILGLGPRIHRAAYSLHSVERATMLSYWTYRRASTHPSVAPVASSTPAERWILGPSPRMTVECAGLGAAD